MDEKWQQLKDWINESDNIVFFGGAGVSTESGIPDFRSVDGLYHQKYDYPPETILSHTFFMNNTDCIIRNISTRRSGSSVTAFTYKIRKSSTASIKTVCCFRMQNLMQPIKPLQNWNRKEN